MGGERTEHERKRVRARRAGGAVTWAAAAVDLLAGYGAPPCGGT